MALTSAGVQQTREAVDNLVSILDPMSSYQIEEQFRTIFSNPDFERFINGTAFGQENYEKWKKLVYLITGDLDAAVENAITAVREFLNKQEQLNAVHNASIRNAINRGRNNELN